MSSSNEDPSDDGRGPDWEPFFPYESPYNDQREGIEVVGEAIDDGGFAVIEGACGTGKTLMALMAAISRVRDPSTKYKRVMCLTSVKQQMRAFEEDIQAINANLSEDALPISGLSLVGKADLCSYQDVGYISSDNIYQQCETLRDEVRREIDDDDKVGSLMGIENPWLAPSGSGKGGTQLSGSGWNSPWDDADPTDSNERRTGCAFYARYRREATENDGPVLPMHGMNTPEELMERASEEGICPHAAMISAIEHVDVLIGNYRHAFDPNTVKAMTGELMDDDTIVVFDEAHTMEEVVRDLLTDELSIYALNEAAKELDNFILNPRQPAEEASNAILAEMAGIMDLDPDKVKEKTRQMHTLVTDLMDMVDEWARDAVRDELGYDWQQQITGEFGQLPTTIEHSLRTPETDDLNIENQDEEALSDELTDRIDGEYEIWEDVIEICGVASEAILSISERGYDAVDRKQTYIDNVGRILHRWKEIDHIQHFREVELERRDERYLKGSYQWEKAYRGRLALKNCIPSSAIANTLDAFGAGVLMSATLEPFDVFEQVTGITLLESESDRPIHEASFGLGFPEENRESFLLDSTKFTYSNRGDPRENNDVRQEYEQNIATVAKTTPGNVLVGMPSYREAKWAANRLRDRDDVDKEVLIDESSSNKETEQLKSDFFDGDGKVLLTSMRGTLTEGVDYDGEKLSACIVCGVPIRNTSSPHAEAIEYAYKRQYGDFEGFFYGFGVPAVRKARQAIGRVIRGTDDVGVRVMMDERYASGYVRRALPDYEREEFSTVHPRLFARRLNQFWNRH